MVSLLKGEGGKVDTLKRFNIENYNFLNTYTLDDWHDAIANRLLYSMKSNYDKRNPTPDQYDYGWEGKYNKDRVEFWEIISVNPDLRRRPLTHSNLKDLPPMSHGAVVIQMNSDYPERDEGIVMPLTLNDLMYLFESAELSDLANDKIRLSEVSPTSLDDYQKGDHAAHNTEVEIYKKYDRALLSLDDPYQAFISIDLSASNEQILDSFSHWLNDQRKSEPKIRSHRITQKDLDDWRTAKIIPYFDLINLAKIDGIRISNHKIGDLLFPDEVDVDVAERVRKVTQPKADKVFHHDTVGIMAAQVLYETTNTEAKI